MGKERFLPFREASIREPTPTYTLFNSSDSFKCGLGKRKKIGRGIKRRGEKGKAQLELKWDHSSHSKGNLRLHSTPYH